MRFSATVEAWLAGFDVRPWPGEAAQHYAKIRASLERARQTMGGMDLLIAAQAMAMAKDSVVVTTTRHVNFCALLAWP